MFNWPDWVQLGLLGKSKPVKLTVLVPFIGYVILFNQQVVELFSTGILNTISETVANSPHSDQNLISRPMLTLVLIYLGLFFLGIASAVFTLLCPPRVTEYKTIGEFQRSELATLSNESKRRLFDECKTRSPDKGAAAVDKATRIDPMEPIDESYIRDVLDILWQEDSHHIKPTRIVTSILFAIGLTLLAIPSLMTFIIVLRYLIRHLFALFN